jgi:hypothetical protein
MMAITTNSSIKVKPRERRFIANNLHEDKVETRRWRRVYFLRSKSKRGDDGGFTS